MDFFIVITSRYPEPLTIGPVLHMAIRDPRLTCTINHTVKTVTPAPERGCYRSDKLVQGEGPFGSAVAVATGVALGCGDGVGGG